MNNSKVLFGIAILFTLFVYIKCKDELEMISSVKLIDAVGEPYDDDDTKLEASGVVFTRDDKESFFVVCDNLREKVVNVDENLDDGDYEDLTWEDDEDDYDVGYEGITFDLETGNFFLLVEDVEIEKDTYRGVILSFDNSFHLISRNEVDFDLYDENAGFEGLAAVRKEGDLYLLALCESSSCLPRDDAPKGNGTVLVLKFSKDEIKEDGKWEVEAAIKLPSKSADFDDYSGLDVFDGKIAVVSQQDSKLWIGDLDIDDWSIDGDDDSGDVYSFPEDKDGKKQFCNVEGVSFIDKHTIAIASDKNEEDDDCSEYSQSLTTFSLP